MPPTPKEIRCVICGTANPADARRCQACGAWYPSGEFQPSQESNLALIVTSILTLLAVGAIGWTLWTAYPGFCIVVGVGAFPPLLRTMLLSRRRRRLGRPLTTNEKIATFIGSLGVVLGICSILVVVAIGTFFFICVAAIGGGDKQAISTIIYIGAAVGVFVVLCFVPLIVRRWRWEVEGDRDSPDR